MSAQLYLPPSRGPSSLKLRRPYARNSPAEAFCGGGKLDAGAPTRRRPEGGTASPKMSPFRLAASRRSTFPRKGGMRSLGVFELRVR
jgi:hypothetical protein